MADRDVDPLAAEGGDRDQEEEEEEELLDPVNGTLMADQEQEQEQESADNYVKNIIDSELEKRGGERMEEADRMEEAVPFAGGLVEGGGVRKQEEEETEEMKEVFNKKKIFEDSEHPSLWNVTLLCKDGQIHQNKLTVGLVFPCLKKCDMFHVMAEPILVMADFTKDEVMYLVQDKFNQLSRKPEKEDPEEEPFEDDDERRETRRSWAQEQPKRRRGRPKGSTSRKVKKVAVKEEPFYDDEFFDDEEEDETYRGGKTATGDSRKPDAYNLPYLPAAKQRKERKKGWGAKLRFPVTFDLNEANEKFNRMLDDIKGRSAQITTDDFGGEGAGDKKTKWKCAECGELCTNLAVHVGRNHADQDFSCGQCDVKTGSEYLLKVHEKSHANEALPCNICGKVVKDMKNHLSQIHDEGEIKAKYRCPNCPKIYVKNAEFQRHFNSAHLGIKANCPICNKELLPNKVASHVRMVHEKIKNHFCPSCGKGFYDKRDMELHIQRIHLGTKELCIECGKELSAGQLKKHIQKCHSGENTKVICPVCGKKVGYLEEHMRSVHKKEKNHACPLCPLKVYKKNTLKRHLEWHEKGKVTVNGTPKKPRILKKNKPEYVQKSEYKDEMRPMDLQMQPQQHEPPQVVATAAVPHHQQLQQQQQQQLIPPPPPHHHQQHHPAAHQFPGFPDPASIMNLANFYRGHTSGF